jgi:Protein of unknown function (DUF3866)
MLTLRRGRVSAVVERLEGLARLEVDGTPCVAYPRLTGPVALGDEVIVNVQARELGLGSGGFDVLYANLTRGLELRPDLDAHVMKLPYTPGQVATRHAEEERELPVTLGALPVVCCSLHSQVVPVCAGLGDDVRVAYVQLPGGALPVSLSDSLRALRERGLIEATVAVGPCVDGEFQSVTAASALLWAAAEEFGAAVCAIGPGIVGTGSPFGHGGIAAAEAANAAHALGGVPVLAVRASETDLRVRHRGVSHHTRAVLELSAGRATPAWPRGYEAPTWLEPRQEVDVDGWAEACAGLPLSHMGRGPEEDPLFFAAAFAAGRFAQSLLV